MTTTAKANHIDLGYKDSAEVNALISANKFFYLKVTNNDLSNYYGAGLGYNNNNYEYVLSINSNGQNESIDFDLTYYDVGPSYFLSIRRLVEEKKTRFGVGIGYPINEKVSLITKYEDGFFFGVRRWI